MFTAEENEFLAKVFPNGLDNELIRFPKKQKQKRVILKFFASRFSVGELYTEKMVNEVIKAHYADFVTVRRDLYEFNFIDRKDDGSAYWLKTDQTVIN